MAPATCDQEKAQLRALSDRSLCLNPGSPRRRMAHSPNGPPRPPQTPALALFFLGILLQLLCQPLVQPLAVPHRQFKRAVVRRQNQNISRRIQYRRADFAVFQMPLDVLTQRGIDSVVDVFRDVLPGPAMTNLAGKCRPIPLQQIAALPSVPSVPVLRAESPANLSVVQA